MSQAPASVIELSARIESPLTEVFRFFASPESREPSTPQPSRIEVKRQPRDVRQGMLFAYRLRRWPFDLEWEALVSEYLPRQRLVQLQSRGSFLEWRHEEHFAAEGTGTRVTEVIRYQMRRSWRAALAESYFVREALTAMLSSRLDWARNELERNTR
jgi:ligand-binding SRPBCC domain-containing protein